MDKLEAKEGADDKEKASVQNYNESIDRMQDRAKRLATGDLNENDIADMATMASIGEHLVNSGIPRLNAEYMKMRSLLIEATQRLTALGGGPSPSGGDGSGDDGNKRVTDDSEYSEAEGDAAIAAVAKEMIAKKFN